MNLMAFKRGLRDGIAIAIGYFSVSFSFGLTAVASGISWWEAVLISLTNLTSSGQFAGIGIIAASGSYVEMMVTELVINMRYALMSISLSQKLDPTFKRWQQLILGHCNTDEIFAVAMSRNKTVTPAYMTGLAVLPYIGWTGGTLCRGYLRQYFADNSQQRIGHYDLRHVPSHYYSRYAEGTSDSCGCMRGGTAELHHPFCAGIFIHYRRIFNYYLCGGSIRGRRAALSGVRRRGGRTCSIITGFIFLSCLR